MNRLYNDDRLCMTQLFVLFPPIGRGEFVFISKFRTAMGIFLFMISTLYYNIHCLSIAQLQWSEHLYLRLRLFRPSLIETIPKEHGLKLLKACRRGIGDLSVKR